MQDFDILCLGSITLDTFIKTLEPLCRNVDGSETFCFPVGAKFSLTQTHEMSGGGAANTAVGFAKLGLNAAALGVVGDDDKKNYILHHLETFGVNTDYIVREKGQQTSLSLIFVTPDGRRTAFTHRVKSKQINKDTILQAPQAKALYISHLRKEYEESLHAIADWKTQLTPKGVLAWNPGKTQLKQGLKAFEDIIPQVDLLILNVEEAEMLMGKHALRYPVSAFGGEIVGRETFKVENIVNGRHLAENYLKAGGKAIIITDGKRGAQYINHNEHMWIPSSENNPKNTLGAGDAFSVGAVWALLQGFSAEKILKAGSLNATATIQAFGAQRGQLSKRQMERFLEG